MSKTSRITGKAEREKGTGNASGSSFRSGDQPNPFRARSFGRCSNDDVKGRAARNRQDGRDVVHLDESGTENDISSTIQQFSSLREACRSNGSKTTGEDHFANLGGNECEGSVDVALQRKTTLANFVIQHCDSLPAEETAKTVVRDIFLATLASPITSSEASVLLDAINVLLQNDKHASAILAHLTVTVDESGVEQSVENPIKTQLLGVLQALLPLSSAACCLTTALRVAQRVGGDRGKASGGAVGADAVSAIPAMDLRAIKSYLRFALDGNRDEREQSIVVDLLLAFLQSIPLSAHALVNELLWNDASFNQTPSLSRLSANDRCTCCGFCPGDASVSPLLRMLHDATDPALSAAAMQCATKLVELLPLHQWLSTSRVVQRNASSLLPRQHGSSQYLSSFQFKVANSIELIVRVAHCRCGHFLDEELTSFVKAVLTRVPFPIDEDGRLRDALRYGPIAVDLVGKLATSTPISANGRKVFMDCLGGHVTPSGHLTRSSTPVVVWLASAAGISFVEGLLVQETSTQEAQKSTISLLHAILRGCPVAILFQRSTWSKFQTLILSSLPIKPLLAAQTMERFLQGRFDFLKEFLASYETTEGEILSFVFRSLPFFVSAEQEEPIQRSGCECYSSLSESDWAWCSSSAASYIKQILSFCSEEVSPSLRTSACKSIGHICTNYFGAKKGALSILDVALFSAIGCALVQTLDPNQPGSVQCMALFALGNLMQTLLNRSLTLEKLNAQMIGRAANASLSLISSSNEKVSANAVRTSAWMVYWVFQYEEECEISSVAYLDSVVDELTRHIQSVLMLCRGGTQTLTWRERSGTKKKGWGACNALAILFEHHLATGSWTKRQILNSYERATSCLLQCVANLTVLHDKVALSAVTALLKLDRSVFRSMALCSNSVGPALSSCCNALFGESGHQNPNLKREMALLLEYMLSCMSTLNVQQACESPTFILQLKQLFEWMVENDSPTDAYRCIAAAISYASLDCSLPADVYQKFANRAARGNLTADAYAEEL